MKCHLRGGLALWAREVECGALVWDALRVELRRAGSSTAVRGYGQDESGVLRQVYPPEDPCRFHFSIGVELGWIPGLAVTAAAGVYIGYLALMSAGAR